jgi:hypothetical protein
MVSSQVTAAVIAAVPALVVGAGTTVVAFYAARLTNSYRRQLDLKTSERRLDAYAALWSLLRVAAPTRRQPMCEAERLGLYEKATDWYYADGNGMMLTALTREVYLRAKENLRCADEQLFPDSLAGDVPSDPAQREAWRGRLSQDQFSLLRTQMKSDLAVLGKVFSGELLPRDIAFLKACGVDTGSEPWKWTPSPGTSATVGRRREPVETTS